MMVHVCGGRIDLIHRTTPGKKKIITKASEKYKAIIGLASKVSPTETKGLDKDGLHNGKMPKSHKLLDVNQIEDIKKRTLYPIGQQVVAVAPSDR